MNSVGTERGAAGVAARAGLRLGEWTLERPLAVGAQGSCWVVRDDEGVEAVAKLLAVPPGAEARALARICHPVVVGFLGAGNHPTPYIVMERAPGSPLSALLRHGPAPEPAILRLLPLLADALATLHAAGIVHRDLKPDNVIVDRGVNGLVSLVDLGMTGHRHGGTYAWAAPECLSGEIGTPASDVFGLGLLAWTMLHGNLPHHDENLSRQLSLRREGAPEPTVGPVWLRRLVKLMLAPDPRERPTAREVADAIASHQGPLEAPPPQHLVQRARRLVLPLPQLQEARGRWSMAGGGLAISGSAGTGRSWAIDHLALLATADGHPVLRAPAATMAWTVSRWLLTTDELAEPPLEWPDDADGELLVDVVVERLLRRLPAELQVFVDDFDCLSGTDARVIARLVARGRRIAVAGTEAPSWAKHRATLGDWDRKRVTEWIQLMLGELRGASRLVDATMAWSEGLPSAVVRFVLAAIETDAVAWRGGSWTVDPARLSALRPAFEQPGMRALSREAREIGALLSAYGGPVALDALRRASSGTEGEIDRALVELVSARLVRLRGDEVQPAGASVVEALAPPEDRVGEVHRAVLDELLQRPSPPPHPVARQLMVLDDPALARQHGPTALLRLSRVDPLEAARVGRRLAERVPDSAAMKGMLLRALSLAGETDEAIQLARGLLSKPLPPEVELEACLELATLLMERSADISEPLQLIGRAGPLGLTRLEHLRHATVYCEAWRRARRPDLVRKVAAGFAGHKPPLEAEERRLWLGLRMSLAQAEFECGAVDEALAIVDATDLLATDPARSMAMHQMTLGRLLAAKGRHGEAADAMSRASRTEDGLPLLERARLMNNTAISRYQIGDLTGCIEDWEYALDLCERMDVVEERLRMLNNLCIGYREARRPDQGIAVGARAWNEASRGGHCAHAAMVAGNLGDLHVSIDDFMAAEEWYARAWQLATQNELEGEQVELQRRRAELAVLRHDPEAVHLAQMALSSAMRAGAQSEAARCMAVLGAARGSAGVKEEVPRLLGDAIHQARQLGSARDLAEVQLWSARAWGYCGLAGRARALIEDVLGYARQTGFQLLIHQTRTLKRELGMVSAPSLQSSPVRLLRLATLFARRSDPEDLFAAIADAALELLEADRVFVLVGPAGQEVACARVRGAESAGTPSRSVVRRALAARKAVVAVDLQDRADFRHNPSVVELRLRSALCAPLLIGDAVIGAIYVDSHTPIEGGTTAASDVLHALAENAAVVVANSERLREAQATAREADDLAHDLRQPASAVLMTVEFMRTFGRVPGDGDLLETVERQARRMLDMVDRWLRPARSQHRTVSLDDLVARTLRLAGPTAAASEVTLRAGDQADAWVSVDEPELERALMNLVANGIRHSPRPGVVSVVIVQDGEGWLVEVHDNGPGLGGRTLAQLLDRGRSETDGGSGRGLGLSISARIVGAHGGQLRAEDHPHGGAVFSVWLRPSMGDP